MLYQSSSTVRTNSSVVLDCVQQDLSQTDNRSEVTEKSAVLHKASFWTLFCHTELSEFFYQLSWVDLACNLSWKTAWDQEKVHIKKYSSW